MNRRQSAAGRTRLRQLGEDRLLDLLLATFPTSADVIVGAGDDCAIVKVGRSSQLLVLKTDCVVEKIHFDSHTDPARVGWKAMMRPLSDFAAVAAQPRFALVTLIVPGTKSISWVRSLYRGLQRAAAKFDVSIVGGETSNSPNVAAISVCAAGLVEKNRYATRRGGRPNDDLYVTGRLGGSLAGKHLQFVPRIEEARWLTANFRVHAMMDVSDGLGVDLPRLARASKTGFKLETELLPLNRGCNIDNALNHGEDFELLFAVAPRDRTRLESMWRKKFPNLKLTRIGSLNRKSVRAGLALENRESLRGYVHFKERR